MKKIVINDKGGLNIQVLENGEHAIGFSIDPAARELTVYDVAGVIEFAKSLFASADKADIGDTLAKVEETLQETLQDILAANSNSADEYTGPKN